jgi:hypothetical protein
MSTKMSSKFLNAKRHLIIFHDHKYSETEGEIFTWYYKYIYIIIIMKEWEILNVSNLHFFFSY